MKLGIPTWDGRVSPVLDVARNLLVVEVEGGVEVGRSEVGFADARPGPRADQVRRLGVEVLICGALSWPLEAILTSGGVRVIARTCGAVEDVLRAFLSGRLADWAFLMPGCCGRRRRFRAGRRHTGRWGVSS